MEPLLEKRLFDYAKVLKNVYLSKQDAAAFDKKYVENLAECMASKIVYGTEYSAQIETQLIRFNSR